MRFSTLTVVVFVAHNSTLAIAAPLPFPGDVQDLVARADDDPPAASSGGTPMSASAHWAQAISSVAKQVPAPIVHTGTPSNLFSVVQKAIDLAQKIPRPQTPRRVFPMPAQPSPVVPKTSPMLDGFKQSGHSAFDPPTGPAPPLTQQAVAQLKKNQAHPVTAALEQLHKGQQSHPLGSSAESKAAHQEGKASQPQKGRRVYKVGKPHTVFKGPKRKASASSKKAKAPKLGKRDLEIDELD